MLTHAQITSRLTELERVTSRLLVANRTLKQTNKELNKRCYQAVYYMNGRARSARDMRRLTKEVQGFRAIAKRMGYLSIKAPAFKKHKYRSFVVLENNQYSKLLNILDGKKRINKA